MIEKIFVFLLLVLIGTLVIWQHDDYENKTREYYYCTPYNSNQNPPLPPLTRLELNNFEMNYPDFTSNYECNFKFYTPKQFNLMRKTRK